MVALDRRFVVDARNGDLRRNFIRKFVTKTVLVSGAKSVLIRRPMPAVVIGLRIRQEEF
jgi:hypothetical protein